MSGIKIVPGKGGMSQGTKVFTESGEEIIGISRIEIKMQVNEPISAVLHVPVVEMEEFEVGDYSTSSFP